MAVSGVNSAAAAASVPPAAAAPVAPSKVAADGDHKTRSASTSQVKDTDGDYKLLSKSAAATSSSAVQSALLDLVKGGR